MIQRTSVSKAQNQYIIPNQRNNKERELNMQTNVKTSNRKELWLHALVNSEYTYIRINKQLVKEERIKTKPINRSFKVYNADGTKNREVIWYVLLEVKINRHKEQINAVITDLNSIDMFLGYDWLYYMPSPPIQKIYLYNDTASQHLLNNSHLSHNTSSW